MLLNISFHQICTGNQDLCRELIQFGGNCYIKTTELCCVVSKTRKRKKERERFSPLLYYYRLSQWSELRELS